MQRIIPNLWFNDTSEEAVQFYTSVFQNSAVNRTDYYTEAGKEQHGHEAGQVVTVGFRIEDARFVAINGGPNFTINPSISFFVHVETREKIDELWSKLSEGGKALMELNSYPFSEYYGWVQDKYGVSWQLILAQQNTTQTIVPSLMFTQNKAGKAEEAMQFYTSVFPDSAVGNIMRYQAGQEPDKEGTIAYGELTILGDKITVMDSAIDHDFVFSPGVSLAIECQTQEEIDTYWDKLSAVPEAEACGWLVDKYGVSWQIVPSVLNDMLRNGSQDQIERVTAAYMNMKKFDIKTLQDIYNS